MKQITFENGDKVNSNMLSKNILLNYYYIFILNFYVIWIIKNY